MHDALKLIIPDEGQAVTLDNWRSAWEDNGLYFITVLMEGRYVPIYAGSTNSLLARAGEHFVGFIAHRKEKYILMNVAANAADSPLFFNYFPTPAYYATEAMLLANINFPCNSDHNGGFMDRHELKEQLESLDPSHNKELDVKELILHVETFKVGPFISKFYE